MVRLIIRIKQIYDKFAADEMTVYAAQASFFTIIAAFPFIMLLLTVVQIVPSVSQGELMEFILALVPVGYKSVAFRVISDLSLKSPATMISVTAITALWSSSRGMMSIAKGLNRVQGKVEKRWYIVKRLICAGYTIVFILVCVLSLGLLVFGTTIQNFVLRQFPLIARVTQHIISLRTLLALAFFMFVFAGIYTYVPDRKLSLKSQLPGAMFTTAGWILFSMAFSLYFKLFGGNNFSYMYGSLTAIVLLMLWLYGCICVLFFGAELNYYLEIYRSEEGKGL
ncbi:YihY/virulence factor BrkB family protein [Clostridium sp. AF18-27]|uniref:YihY/virulence factor BrkB family protein n=1 Tax=Enterocloster TaxID=2719313 RepID=UPI000E502F08|nr:MULTISPECIES: YihY/virulence factor BrkB family protein [Enterocloster]MBS5605344.1 YihY/virulence factor BrkB family protein [Enterocloster asparagiformis]MCB6346136.1 YihY/virulence factor BrkB family protein [Enterocloster lavalensis]MDR3758929.1 YihY/virulence factor BrkB family protein [Enterocloster sp.]RHR54086.1 YihY/virulence factor BrkB family protein [Clostridium sp. AF18-27]